MIGTRLIDQEGFVTGLGTIELLGGIYTKALPDPDPPQTLYPLDILGPFAERISCNSALQDEPRISRIPSRCGSSLY